MAMKRHHRVRPQLPAGGLPHFRVMRSSTDKWGGRIVAILEVDPSIRLQPSRIDPRIKSVVRIFRFWTKSNTFTTKGNHRDYRIITEAYEIAIKFERLWPMHMLAKEYLQAQRDGKIKDGATLKKRKAEYALQDPSA